MYVVASSPADITRSAQLPPHLEAMAVSVKAVMPQVPIAAIRLDILRTKVSRYMQVFTSEISDINVTNIYTYILQSAFQYRPPLPKTRPLAMVD